MATLPDTVKPGQLIKADLINGLILYLQDLDVRVSQLETSGGSTGIPAIGYLEVRYVASARGINMVPGDPAPYPHTFTVVNNTNQTLRIQLSGNVTAPHGNWSGRVLINDVTLASGASQNVDASVTVPNDAQIGDTATLNITATAPAPNNMQATFGLPVNITATTGPAVTSNIRFTNVVTPSSNTDDVNPSTPNAVLLSYALSLRYSTSQATTTANFKCTATLTASSGSVDDWGASFLGLVTTRVSSGVFASPEFPMDATAPSDQTLTLRVRTPLARDTVDKIISFKVRVDSTNLTPAIFDESGPFTLRLRHS